MFGNEVGERVTSIRTAWENACERARIRNLRFHDLRLEYASRLMESGAPLQDIKTLLGHANIKTTSGYLRTNMASITQTVKLFEKAEVLRAKAAKQAAKKAKARTRRTLVAQNATDTPSGPSFPPLGNTRKLLN